jgi:RNA polymerase sigma factor (sigma-70 family)
MQKRKEALENIKGRAFDVCIIGGGATGASCALDAQTRGLKTVVIEAGDFASGSSTASTKMAHGGVRYLQEAVNDLDIKQYNLVDDALRERLLMLRSAPHLTKTIEFLVPCFSSFEKMYYGLGMKMYNWISGKSSLLPSRVLTREEALFRMPPMQDRSLVGAVAYADGQFDDARYGLALIETFTGVGGDALNYAKVTALQKDDSGRIASVTVADQHSQETFQIRARAFVNATGPFSDVVRQLASPGASTRMRPIKGVYIMLPLDDFSETDALLVPKTEDGRVIFAVPWGGRLLIGTTDTEYKPGETIFKAFTHLHQFRFEACFKTWLTRIALNEIAQNWRRRAPGRWIGLEDSAQTVLQATDPSDSPFRAYERSQTAKLLQRALNSLPERYRVVVRMRDLEERSISEVAEALCITIGAVKSRHHRGRSRIAQFLSRPQKVTAASGEKAWYL